MTVDTFPFGIALFVALAAIAVFLEVRKREKGERSNVERALWLLVWFLGLLALAFCEMSH